jgi:hypothetical protein
MSNIDIFKDYLLNNMYSNRQGYMERNPNGGWITKELMMEKLDECNEFWKKVSKDAEVRFLKEIKFLKFMWVSMFFLNIAFLSVIITLINIVRIL